MSFTPKQVQGIFGEFRPVLDVTVAAPPGSVQGVFGQFVVVLDEAEAAPTAAEDPQFVDFPASPGIAVQHRVVST